MTNSLEHGGFSQPVFTRGYRWIEGQTESGYRTELLVPSDFGQGWQGGFSAKPRPGILDWEDHVEPRVLPEDRFYNPMDVPDLHLTFARLKCTPESFLKFARKYGILGVSQYWVTVGEELSVHWDEWQAESFLHWRMQVALMKEVINLWEMVRRDDQKGLRERIEWREVRDPNDPLVPYFHYAQIRGLHTAIATRYLDPDVLEIATPRGVIRPAVAMIRRIVNEQIRGLVSPQLSLRKPNYNALSYEVVPICLQGALWLHVANWLTGQKKTAICVVCRKQFSYERSSKRTCSDACRKRLNRKGGTEQSV